jgi:hypothetical protein
MTCRGCQRRRDALKAAFDRALGRDVTQGVDSPPKPLASSREPRNVTSDGDIQTRSDQPDATR